MRLSIIVAASEQGVIGSGGQIPWRIPADFRLFKMLTMGHTLIMGRKTYESVGKPLPGRTTIVVSRNPELFRRRELPAGVILMPSMVKALEEAVGTNRSNETFVCGGAKIYSAAFRFAERIYLTRVHGAVVGDTVVPELNGGVPEDFVEIDRRELSTEGATHASTFHIYNRQES